MKKNSTMLFLPAFLMITACATSLDQAEGPKSGIWERIGDFFEFEQDVPLDKVPASALEAAHKAVKGIEFLSAEKEWDHGEIVYDLDGIAGSFDYDVEVTADGRVLEIEREPLDQDSATRGTPESLDPLP